MGDYKQYIAGIFTVLTFILYPFAGLAIFQQGCKLYVLSGAIAILFSFPTLFKIKNYLSHPFIYTILAFLGLSTLSILWSIDINSTIYGLIKLYFMFLFSFSLGANLFKDMKFYLFIFWGIVLSLLVTSSVILYKVYFVYGPENFRLLISSGNVQSGNLQFNEYLNKIFASFPLTQSQNLIASLFVFWFTLLLFYPLFLKFSKFLQILLWVVIFLSSSILYFAISKTAFIILLTFLPLIGIIAYRYHLKAVFTVLLAITIAQFLWLAINPFDIRKGIYVRMVSAVEPASKDISISSRIDLWKYTLNEIKKKPLSGYGYRGKHQEFVKITPDRVNSPHNIYLQITLELGVAGLLILLSILMAIIFFTFKLKSPLLLITAAIILTYFIVSVFSGFQFDELFIWTCLGIFSFGLKEKDDKTKK